MSDIVAEENNPAPVSTDKRDPLSEVLHLLNLSGTFYCVPELTAPWGIAVPELAKRLVLIVVTEGKCILDLKNGDVLELGHGQLALLPHGRAVDLRDNAGSPLTPLFDIPAKRHSPNFETMSFGGGGAMTRMTCGVLKVDHVAAERLIELLPQVIFLDEFDLQAGRWLEGTLQYLAEEARNPQPGGETVLTRLTDILVVQAIRSWLKRSPDQQTGWIAALRDLKVGKALQVFHKEPDASWTIERLAQHAGMSRSAFAARFKELTGDGVMNYVTRWRMQLACSELKNSGSSLAEIASSVGYESEAAFARAFKRVVGHTPASFRKL